MTVGSLATRKMVYRVLHQYKDAPKFVEMIRSIGLLMDETDAVIEYLMFGRYIDTAEGVHLDRIGRILGYPRPYAEREDVFTYRAIGDTNYSSKGFGTLSNPATGGAYSTIQGLFSDTLIDDDAYRILLKIRAKAITSNPDIASIYTWIVGSFGVDCTVIVPYPGRIEILITSGNLTAHERYLIQWKSPALPGITVLLTT